MKWTQIFEWTENVFVLWLTWTKNYSQIDHKEHFMDLEWQWMILFIRKMFIKLPKYNYWYSFTEISITKCIQNKKITKPDIVHAFYAEINIQQTHWIFQYLWTYMNTQQYQNDSQEKSLMSYLPWQPMGEY